MVLFDKICKLLIHIKLVSIILKIERRDFELLFYVDMVFRNDMVCFVLFLRKRKCTIGFIVLVVFIIKVSRGAFTVDFYH